MKRHSTLSNEIWLLKLMMRYDKRYPLFLLASIAAKLALPFLSALLPAAAVAALTRGGGMGHYLAVIVGLMALYAGCTFLRDWLENRNNILKADFRMEVGMAMLMEKTMTMDYNKLEPAEGQKLLSAAKNMAGNPMAGGIDGMLRAVEPWLRSLLGLLLYGAAAVALDWRILLVLAAMTAANYAIALWAWRFNMRTKGEADKDLRGQNYFFRLSRNPANGKDIRLYRMEQWIMGAVTACVMRRDSWRRRSFGRRALRSVSDSVFLVLRDLLAYAMLVGSFLAGDIDAAGFTLTIGVISTFTNWLNMFVAASDDWRYETLEVDDFRNFLDQEDIFNHGPGPDVSKVQSPPRVELRDVTFTYPGGEKPVIDHLNLTIRPGEKIALVGLNGAGKTTLVKLLSGLYRPTGGEILVDGVPAADFNAAEYLRLVGTLYQDVKLLPFTVGENVSGAEDYDRERVWACLEKAGLREAVEALPKGLDTSITQRLERDGVDLSGGQQQRLLFARALYKDAPILILDEPTAALDPLAEADLYHKYAREMADKTGVFISHRLGSTQFCDRVVYLDSGRITETGTHQELLARGGAYAKLFEVQSSWYKDEKKEDGKHEET